MSQVNEIARLKTMLEYTWAVRHPRGEHLPIWAIAKARQVKQGTRCIFHALRQDAIGRPRRDSSETSDQALMMDRICSSEERFKPSHRRNRQAGLAGLGLTFGDRMGG